MGKLKKIITYVLTLTLVVSTLYVNDSKKIMADSTYMIKITDSDTYLYANGGNVAAGGLNSGDTRYYWIVIPKDDGSYWIQNQSTGSYMAIENQTGKIELLGTIYDVWASCKWNLNPSTSTTIQSVWLGAQANISVSGADAVYGSYAQSFTLVNTSGETPGPSDPIITGGYADAAVIPDTNDDMNSIGATMPYTRYDSKQASIGGGAVLATSDNYDKNNLASQASEQSYVRLPYNGAYAEWTMSTTGNGVTMRFTMPDSSDGMGLNGSLDVYVNGNKVKTVNLSSYYMWQYFEAPNPAVNPTGSPSDVPVSGATPCFAFDEVHFKLDTSLNKGDKIRIQSSGTNGLEYGVDFLEIEETGAPISKPSNAYSVTDYGAVANDGNSDYTAIQNCISAAQRDGKDVYFPEGTFEIDRIWVLNASNIKITGAGMWYTNIKFTNANSGMGGISGSKAQNVEFCNMYLNSSLRSRYEQNAVYKCFMDVWSGGSYIHDIWEEHFECGFWIADYNFGDGTDYSDGLKITNSRIRNNLADGVNFCQGTSSATVYNCSIRNNGDDGLAMWNNNYNVKDEENNVFCYNTIEFIWRAGGIAIYGGNGHRVYNNYIADTFMASGIHVNSQFDGYKYTNNSSGITFSNNILVRSGTTSDSWYTDMAAVDITEPNGNVRNITFNNTYIYNSQHDGVRVTGSPSNVVFNNLKVYGTGVDGNITYSDDNGAAIKFADKNSSSPISVNGFEYANIAYSGIIYGSRNSCSISNETNLGSNYSYEIPSGTQNGVVEQPIEPETTTEEPTLPDGFVKAGANWTELNYWSVYFASGWGGNPTGSYKDGGSYNDFAVRVDQASGSDWGIQLKTQELSVTTGKKYVCKVNVNTNMVCTDNVVFKEDNSQTQEVHTLNSGNNSFELEFTATDNAAQLVFDLGHLPQGMEFTVTSFSLTEIEEEITTIPESTTAEPTTEAPTTKIEETTTKAETPIEVIGAIINEVIGNTVTFAWGQTDEQIALGQNYNVYIDGQLYKTTQTAETLAYTFEHAGNHTVTIKAVLGNQESEGVTLTVVIEEVTTVEPTTEEATTVEPSTEEATTVEPSTEEITTVEPTTEEVTAEEETTTVKTIEGGIKINGYQISTQAQGMRTVYSVDSIINGKSVVSSGIVYSLVGYAEEADMYVGSTSYYVRSYQSTSAGKCSVSFTDSDIATSYAMTMKFATKGAAEYTAGWRIRAYAELSDGSYVYTKVYTYTIYDIADYLYQNLKMNTISAHDYLYTDILSIVDKNYAIKDFNWNNTVVGADTI